MNGLTHGITAGILALNADQLAERATYMTAYVEGLAPVGPIELSYAEAAAGQAWRLKRAQNVDETLYILSEVELPDSPGLSQALAFVNNSAEFQRLTIYESRIQRSMERSLKALTRPPKRTQSRPRRRPRRGQRLSPPEPSKGFTLRPRHRPVRFFSRRNPRRSPLQRPHSRTHPLPKSGLGLRISLQSRASGHRRIPESRLNSSFLAPVLKFFDNRISVKAELRPGAISNQTTLSQRTIVLPSKNR